MNCETNHNKVSHKHIESHVNRTQPKNRSAGKQAKIVRYLEQRGAFPNSGPDVRTREILDDVPEATRTLIKNLVEKSNLVEEVPPQGGRTFIFHERKQQRISGQNLGQVVDDEVQRLMPHVNNDAQVRKAVANALNVPQGQVQYHLSHGSAFDRMERLDDAVKAIERDPNLTKGGHNYGRIGFRRASNRYRLTPKGVRLIQK